MMNYKVGALALLALFVSLEVSALTRVGNGGDVVLCEKMEGSPFEGYYSYDYLATYNLANANADLVTMESIGRLESEGYYLHYVSGVIARIMGERHDEFVEFYKNVDNFTDRTASQIWLARPGELIDVPNLPHLRHLPKNCQKIYQAVIRYELGQQIVYEVNAEIMKALKDRPLQLAFLRVHEFLWEIYPTLAEDAMIAQKRFEFTRFLFTRAAQEWEPQKVWDYLSRLEVIPPGEIFKNYLAWSEKYNPGTMRHYRCTGVEAFAGDISFDIVFSYVNYGGSSGGWYYSQVQLVDPVSGSTSNLFKRPVDTAGLYVFENRYDVQLSSSNPLDGSFENNMSDEMPFRVSRGGGMCRLIDKQE